MEMFDLMLDRFGPQHWWPGETGLEIMVGAMLTQNTNWSNVEKAILNLKTEDLLTFDALQAISTAELAARIRPAGYYNIKAGRLKNLIGFIEERYDGDIETLLSEETMELREGLLSVKGVGPETADSIILYAARRPVFVIDAYTYRILNRHDLADDQAGYYDLQALFMDNLQEDVSLFNEFHALIVRVGKECCRRKPLCSACPLEGWES
ncbi:MAG: endonuclease III domain-containing protein [Deltaproteobacteria bacterium]|nr:endonuclease III domain-containing protein [Deltaproteobacteria bacterium]